MLTGAEQRCSGSCLLQVAMCCVACCPLGGNTASCGCETDMCNLETADTLCSGSNTVVTEKQITSQVVIPELWLLFYLQLFVCILFPSLCMDFFFQL